MKFKLEQGGDIQVITVFEETKEVESSQEIFNFIKEKEIFKGKLGEVYTHLSHQDDSIVFLGLGKKEKLEIQGLRRAFFKLGRSFIKNKIKSAGISLNKFDDLSYKKTISAVAEGLLNSEYKFEKYVTEKKLIPTMETFYIDPLSDKTKAKKSLDEILNIMDGIFLARELVNEPAIVATPKYLADKAKEELGAVGVEVEILGKTQIEALGMNAFLAVSKGSDNEPQLIVMKWNGDKESDKKIALVGKGLTYDSGGYSLKPTNSMDTMFCDMGGAGAVIGAMKAIATNNLNKNVVGIVAACENLISGGAYKPGDIITTMSGKTVEINNTDAEGRLTLADAIWYATDNLKADKVIDLATLTGACVIALGEITTGAVTNDEKFMKKLIKAAKKSGEYVWQLPSFDEYKELIESSRADLSNTGVRGAGTITAGLFLENFVANDTPWIHLDIAGTAYLSKAFGYLPNGATGIPIKTLYNLIKKI